MSLWLFSGPGGDGGHNVTARPSRTTWVQAAVPCNVLVCLLTVLGVNPGPASTVLLLVPKCNRLGMRHEGFCIPLWKEVASLLMVRAIWAPFSCAIVPSLAGPSASSLSQAQKYMVIVPVFERLKSRCCCCYEISLLMEKEVCGCML